MDRHMSVAEVKRHFSDVMGEVMHTRRRIIVERRGRPMVAIVPLEEETDGLTPGERLAAQAGFAGEVSEEFEQIMKEVLEARHDRSPRPTPEFEP